MRNAVGLDISKTTFDATAIIGGIEKSAKFDNDGKGFEQFKDWLDKLKCPDAHICMEATGNYYEGIADYIGSLYKVSVVNPLKISKYAESRFTRTKTDKQDAKLIAEYCQTAKAQDLVIRKPVINDGYKLKRLSALYAQLTADSTAQKNRLEAAKDTFVVKICQSNINHLQRQIKAVKKELEKLTKQPALKDQTDRLATIPAIGRLTAVMLLNYLSGTDFPTSNKFAAFAGLTPQIKDSGTSVRGKPSLTRYGNRRLRAMLFMPAMVAYRIKAFPDFIARLEAKNKPKKVIIAAIMRKLAVIAYHVHKKGEDYDPTRYKAA